MLPTDSIERPTDNMHPQADLRGARLEWVVALVSAVMLAVAAPACVSNPTPHPGTGDGSGTGDSTGVATGGQGEPGRDGSADGAGNGTGGGADGGGAGDGGTSEPPLDSLADVGGELEEDATDDADGELDAGPDADDAMLWDDTDAGPALLMGTLCEDQIDLSDDDEACEGNVGCTELDVECGECVCTLCANDNCLVTTCDDGGSDDCPGSPWDEPDAGGEDG